MIGRYRRRNISERKGFTLIELLVVITIIGILASVVLSSLDDARMSARDTKRLLEVKQLQTALELFANKNSGQYPCQNGTIDANPCTNTVALNNTDTTIGAPLRNELNLELQPDSFRTNFGSIRNGTIRYRLARSGTSASYTGAMFDSYTILVWLEQERTNADGETTPNGTPCLITVGRPDLSVPSVYKDCY